MRSTLRWFLAILGGLLLTLGGLAWDAVIHSQAPGHALDESLLNLTNPGHVVFGAGLVLTVIMTLLGFTASWLDERRGPQSLANAFSSGCSMAHAGVGRNDHAGRTGRARLVSFARYIRIAA